MGILNDAAIEALGFRHVGKNVRLSDKASFYNPAMISIGDHSRIDDFCVLSAGEGGISIGNYVHIAVYTSLIGKGSIRIDDFSNISSKVAIYSSNDDYSGEFMTNPTVNEQFTNVSHGDIILGKHVIVGSGSLLLPKITVGEGACIGAMSMINKDCEAFTVYTGIPATKVKARSRKLLEQEAAFREWQLSHNSGS